MIDTIKKIFGGTSTDYRQLVADGAIILDVRTKGEYASGHIKNSINIPVDQLSSGLKKLDKSKVVITCCASGMRSASAKRILEANGFAQVFNGGGWGSLNSKL